MTEWQHGLFGCFDNVGLCVITFLVPCYTFGKNAEALGENCLVCGLCMSAIAAVALRQRLRVKRGIRGSLTSDMLTWMCCGVCALMQEAQEIRDAQSAGQMMARE